MNYTNKHLKFLEKYRTLDRKALTELFNKKFNSRQSSDAIKGICLRKGYLTGRTGQFKKGSKPWNTGTKGLCKVNNGCFKKGQIPINHRPVGSERITVDGYREIKVAEPNKWRFKHAVVWEQHCGKLQKGELVRFKDNDRLNYNIENLEKMSRRLHLRLNQTKYETVPLKFKPTARTIAELELKIFDRKRSAM